MANPRSANLRPLLPMTDESPRQPAQLNARKNELSRSACTTCHRAKSKCDRALPRCARCQSKDLECNYISASRGSVDSQIQRLLAENEALKEELKQASDLLESRNRQIFENRQAASVGSSSPSTTASQRHSGPVRSGQLFAAQELDGERSLATPFAPVYNGEAAISGNPSVTDGNHEPQGDVSNPINSNYLASINGFLSKGSQLPAVTSEFSKALDDHIAITAITKSWDQIRKQFILDPQWECVADLDIFLSEAGRPIDRLCGARNTRQAMTYFSVSRDYSSEWIYSDVPRFMEKRPIQHTIEHDDVIDYCPWPRLRELSILQPETYFNELFASRAVHNWRFAWPFDLSSSFEVNPGTGLLQVSKEFQTRASDLHCWTMSRDFFDFYPDLLGDIAMYEPSLTTYVPRGSSINHSNRPERLMDITSNELDGH